MRVLVIAVTVTLVINSHAFSQKEGKHVQRKAPDCAVPGTAEIQKGIRQGVKLLVGNQERYERDRTVGRLGGRLPAWQERERKRLAKIRRAQAGKAQEWPYEGVYRVRGGVIPPGYRVGGSAIVCEALAEVPGLEKDKARRGAIARSLRFMVDELEKNELLYAEPQRTYDVRCWGHAYALKFFLRALELKLVPKKLAPRVKRLIPDLLSRLKIGQVQGGGWNYAGRGVSPFMTGATLITLYDAKAKGHDVDAQMVAGAIASLKKARTESGSYAYSGSAGKRPVPMPGSSARAAIAELALLRAGHSSTDRLRVAVEGFFEGWNDLLWRKEEEGTHVGEYSIAPYYFMFGHTYVGLAIEYLPEQERPKYRDQLRQLLWRTRQKNGGWNDRVFPRTESYSTAMAILALLAPDLPKVPEWQPKEN